MDIAFRRRDARFLLSLQPISHSARKKRKAVSCPPVFFEIEIRFFWSAQAVGSGLNGFGCADFETVQALLLMSVYMLSSSRRDAAYDCLGKFSTTPIARPKLYISDSSGGRTGRSCDILAGSSSTGDLG